MLVLKKELSFYEFMEEFSYELKEFHGLTNEGVEIVFNTLCEHELVDETVQGVSDYLRYEMQVLNLDDVIHDYGYLMDLDGLEGNELIEAVRESLENYTFVLGTYEDDGELIFIFYEF